MATPLYLAVSNGHKDAVELLLDMGVDPNAKDMRHNPIYVTIMRDSTTMAKLLISRGLNVNMKFTMDFTMLHHAVMLQSIPIIEVLIEAGADIHAITYYGSTPLRIACHMPRVTEILKQHGATH